MTDDREGRERDAGPPGPGAAEAPDGGPAADAMAGRGAGDLDDYAEVAAAAAAGGLAGPADDGAQEASAADLAELARLQEEIDGLNDRHLRLAAEFDNYRKRIERERAEQHTRSQASLAGRLLDALDDLQRVEHFDPASVSTESLLEALALVERKFRQALEAAGLEEVLAQGEIFDPNTMEAVMTAPAEHPEEDEVVADVFRKGYRFGNTLVRPAQVRVKKYED